MKRKVLLLVQTVLLLSVCSSLHAFNEILKFDLSEFTLDIQDNILSIVPNKPSFTYDYNTVGNPNIPFCIIKRETNNVADLKSLKYEVIDKELVASGIDIEKYRGYILTNGTDLEPLSQPVEDKGGIYPEEQLYLYNGPAFYDNRIILSVSPFYYDAQREELWFIHSMRVSYTEEEPAESRQSVAAQNRSLSFDYLIITQDSLVETYKRLRDWKTMKGVKTKIVTVDSIHGLYPNGGEKATPVDIKRFIKNCYDYYGITKVLLGGTDDIVPAQSCRVKYIKKGYVPCVGYTPSDYFYSCLEGTLDWDANQNGIVGEVDNDGVVLTPTVSLTRLPIDTKRQLSDYIDKLLSYEKNPPRQNYVNKLLLAGDSLHWMYQGQSDAQVESEMLYELSFPESYTDISKYCFFDTGNNLGRQGLDSLMNTENLKEVIETYTPHFFNMDSHGLEEMWTFSLSNFSFADVSSLNNDEKPMIVTTSACCTADFTYPYPCLGEAFISKPKGGALAYWGSSNYGFGTESFSNSLSTSMQICSDFWRMLPSFCHYGDAVNAAKIDNLHLATSYNRPYNWLVKSMNAFGDCEMPIYLNNPDDFSDVKIFIDYNQVVIESEEFFDAFISSKGDNGESFFFQDNNIRYTSADIQAHTCNVCLTKQNYVPFVVESGRFVGNNENYTLFLQNQRYPRNQVDYSSTNIRVGKM